MLFVGIPAALTGASALPFNGSGAGLNNGFQGSPKPNRLWYRSQSPFRVSILESVGHFVSESGVELMSVFSV
jgi:hypothetical protein